MKLPQFFLGANLLLAACGGGGSGGGGGDPDYEAMRVRSVALNDRIVNATATPADSMPTAGTATYSGLAGFSTTNGGPSEIMSEASLTANFDNSSISGGLANFRHYQNGAMPGSVSFQNGTIDKNKFEADLGGSLTVQNAAAPVAGQMTGVFGGGNADLASGLIEADIGSRHYFGALAAEKE